MFEKRLQKSDILSKDAGRIGSLWFGVTVLKMLYDDIDVGLDCYYIWGVENIEIAFLVIKFIAALT